MNCPTCGTALDSRSTFCPTCGRSVDDPHVGQIIAGRYQVEKRIAIGGFGSIYRAEQLDADRQVALKVMHRELAADANLVARFRREGEVLLQLRDRHTVATYELGETPEGLPFIAMELLEGESLLRLFTLHGRMPWQRMFAIARGVCSALREAHALGIVHRDLKPGNIFVTTDEVAKVLDFGIAKIMATTEMPNPRELTVMGTAVGTLEYMAPEQLMGGKADGRTDIYTLGVLAYEMITGRRPFNVVGLELLTVQLTEQPAPPSSLIAVPALVDDVLLRCLQADSADRYADVQELARALDAAITTYVTGPFPRAPVTAPFEPVSRAATPLPSERPVRLRTQLAPPSPVMIGVAIILLLTGIGLFVAYFA
ncbi:MAG TPA: serine/threonine-protein kinase [Kofleriaceae bacterium]